MRLIFRFVLLTLVAVLSLTTLFADHLDADCPLSFVGSSAASSGFGLGPHGIVRNGSLLYMLRGGTLTTLNITDVGDITLARPVDPLTTLGREPDGGVVYNNGHLYVSTERGLEIYDIRGAVAGGAGPQFVTTIPGVHYRRLATSGGLLAGLFPMNDIPCSPFLNTLCRNFIDIYSIDNPAGPVLLSRVTSIGSFFGFEDIAFANGFLYTTGDKGTMALNLGNPFVPTIAANNGVVGKFLVTNGTNLLGIGQDTLIGVFTLGPGAAMNRFTTATLPSIVDRVNDLRFHPEAWFEGFRLITMIDEVDPMNRPQDGVTGRSARTIAFDVFDLSIPFFDGFDDRIYENVSYTFPDEVKHDPIAVGPYVYVVGEMSGLQKWGACGQIAGRIEFDRVQALACGGAEIHGWVTGAQRITAVELFLDNTLIGNASFGLPRTDIHAPTTAVGWRVSVNLDSTAAGTKTLRAIGTDVNGNRRQFASVPVNFPGPPSNCTTRRRISKR